jgi:hypothetical protein
VVEGLAWLAVFGLGRWPVKVTVLALVSTTTSLSSGKSA